MIQLAAFLLIGVSAILLIMVLIQIVKIRNADGRIW